MKKLIALLQKHKVKLQTSFIPDVIGIFRFILFLVSRVIKEKIAKN